MLEQLGLIGTILDDEESPKEPDTESEEVSLPAWKTTHKPLIDFTM